MTSWPALTTALIVIGVALIAAAIVGGGLQIFGFTVPGLRSKFRSVLLALFGVVVLLGVYVAHVMANPAFQVTHLTVAWDHAVATPSHDPDAAGCDFAETYTAQVSIVGHGDFEYVDDTLNQRSTPRTWDVSTDDAGHMQDIPIRVLIHLSPGQHLDVPAVFAIWDDGTNTEALKAVSDNKVLDCRDAGGDNE